MDVENVRNTLGTIGIVLMIIIPALSFGRVVKRPEYEELMKDAKRINLNLFTLLAAFFRDDTDPLKAAHLRLAKIGFAHFFAMIFGIVLVFFVAGAATVFIGD